MSTLTKDDLVIDAHYRVIHNHSGHKFEIGQTIVFKGGFYTDAFRDLDDTETWYLTPAEVLPLPPRAEWVSAVASGQTDLGYEEWAEPRPVPTERSYAIGVPVSVTVRDDGSVEFEVDLSEVHDIDEDEDAFGRYGEEQVHLDTLTVSAAASRLQNVLTRNITAQEAS